MGLTTLLGFTNRGLRGAFHLGGGLGTQSLEVCQSPGGDRDEFPGLLASCLPPSAHLLLSQVFSSFFLLPPSSASSSYAGPVHRPGMWCAVGVLGGHCGRMEGQTPVHAFLTLCLAQRRGNRGVGTWLGAERGCCINQKQSRSSCLWPGNTSVIPGAGKELIYMYVH